MNKGRFGEYGGQYISETLMNELINLEEKYEYYKNDKEVNDELNELLNFSRIRLPRDRARTCLFK